MNYELLINNPNLLNSPCPESAMPRGMLARPRVQVDERGGGAGRRPVNTVVHGGVAGRGRNGAARMSCSPREGS